MKVLTRFTLAALLAAFLLPATFSGPAFAQSSVEIPAQKGNISTSVSGTVLKIDNPSGVLLPTFAEKITGSPSTVSIVIQGCMTGDVQGDNCDTLETNTTTTGRQIRHPSTSSTVYDYFLITPSWTGGTNTAVTINSTLSPNARNGGGLGSTTAAQIAGLFSGCSGTQYLGFDGACHTAGVGTGDISGTTATGKFVKGGATNKDVLDSGVDIANPVFNTLVGQPSTAVSALIGRVTNAGAEYGIEVQNKANNAHIAGINGSGLFDGTIAEAGVNSLVSDLALKAPLASPTFTGTPAAPTAAVDTNTTQLASTAYVLAQAASANPIIDGTAAPGTATRYARADHVHPTDTTRQTLVTTTLGDLTYGGAAGAATRLSGPIATNGVAQFLTSTPASGAAIAPAWTPVGVSVNAQTGTTYTILATDRASYVSFSNASAVAVTLPQANTTGFASNFFFRTKSLGAGAVTITPTTSTINGNATLVINQGESCLIFSDNTNYFSACASGQITATSPITSTRSVSGEAIACATCTVTVASGTSALGTGAITNATCATVVTTAATGTATTDVIASDFNADPTGVTGYNPAAAAQALTIFKYPTANNVNFKVCNFTAGSITPGAITLNWRVVR